MNNIMALPADAPRSIIARNVAWVYATVLTCMAIGQLFSFEKFIPLVKEYQLPGGLGTATLVAGLIVVTEVFALPFLLRMRLSLLMRWVSLACSLMVPILWIVLSVTVLVVDGGPTNSGLLGTKLSVPAGWLQLVASIVLAGLAGFSFAGLRPSKK